MINIDYYKSSTGQEPEKVQSEKCTHATYDPDGKEFHLFFYYGLNFHKLQISLSELESLFNQALDFHEKKDRPNKDKKRKRRKKK